MVTSLQNEILKNDKNQFKKWKTRLLGGHTVNILDDNEEVIGTAHVTGTMKKILGRIKDAMNAIRIIEADLGNQNNIYRQALLDIHAILVKACSQNESKTYINFFGRDDSAINIYPQWRDRVGLALGLDSQHRLRPVLGADLV